MRHDTSGCTSFQTIDRLFAMSSSIVTTPSRWFVRGFLVGILITGSLTAVSYFFRSERGGNLLGTTPDHYEALGFPCTLWETGNTYGGLFVDLRALLVNALFSAALGASCGLATWLFRGRLTDLVERLEQTVTARQQAPQQASPPPPSERRRKSGTGLWDTIRGWFR